MQEKRKLSKTSKMGHHIYRYMKRINVRQFNTGETKNAQYELEVKIFLKSDIYENKKLFSLI